MIVKTVTLHTGGEQGRWTTYALDTFFGPHLSELTACTAPDVPEMPPYLIRFAFNRGAFSSEHDIRQAKSILTASYIRHSSVAITEYRDGTAALRRYVSAPRERSSLSEHELAVSRFQNCLIQASAGQSCLGVLRQIEKSLVHPDLYASGDGSVRQRLDELANRVRHFRDDIWDAAKKPPYGPFWVSPIWLTNTGITARKHAVTHSLTYQELADYLVAATADAETMSDLPFTVP